MFASFILETDSLPDASNDCLFRSRLQNTTFQNQEISFRLSARNGQPKHQRLSDLNIALGAGRLLPPVKLKKIFMINAMIKFLVSNRLIVLLLVGIMAAAGALQLKESAD